MKSMPDNENIYLASSKDQELLYKKICELHAGDNIADCLKKIDATKSSYYEEWKSPWGGIREYSLESVPVLREELQALWSDQGLAQMIPNVIASAFKAKERITIESQYEEELPQYIYNF